MPPLQDTPLWASLLLIVMLGTGPGLSPDFQSFDISASPVLFEGDGDQILLLNLEPEGELTPGSTITLSAAWFIGQPVGFDYNVFVHAITDEDRVVAQLDTQPQTGDRPMTTWLPGETIIDVYSLALPADAPANLSLLFGLYNWQTGERLTVEGRDAMLILQDDLN